MPSTTPLTVVEPNRPPRRLMVILHADMVGYSRLIGRDDAGTFLRLRALRRDIIDPALATHHGALRNTAGDSLLVTFDSIDQAIEAALAIQHDIEAHQAPHDEQIKFRIGINLGDAILDDRDLYGDGINVAARLQAACPPGRICVSRAIRDHARQRRDMRFEPLGSLSLKNIEKPVDAFILAPQAPAGALRRLAAAVPTWRVRKAYAALAAIIPLVSLVVVGVRYYADLGASRSQQEQVAALTASQKAIAEAIARDKGVPLSVIARILTRLEESAATPQPDGSGDGFDLQRRLEAKADEFVLLRQQLQQLTGDGPKVADLRAQADTALGKSDLSGARGKLHEAAALEMTAISKLEERTRGAAVAAAGLLEKSARIAAVTLRYRDAAGDFGQAAAIVAPFDRHEQWRLELERAAMLRLQGDEFGDREALTASIEHINTALTLVSRSQEPLDWARTQNELGRTLRALGQGEFGTDRLEQAAACLRLALEATPRDIAPDAWADIQSRLGTVLWRIGERESGTRHLEEAVSVLQSALQGRNQATAPLQWADTADSLGVALVALGRRERGTERLEQGLAVHRAVEAEYGRHGHSLDWAGSMNGVGVALSSLGRREAGTARLEQAVDAYRQALTVRTRDRVPLYWARVMDNLGLALRLIGEREDGTARLEEAIATFRLSLQERTAARVPRDRATTQSNLARALFSLADRQGTIAPLRDAALALQEAAASKSRQYEPLPWAEAQYDLGNALTRVGEREGGTASLEAAIAAYGQALAERPVDRVPLLWAISESSMAWAMMRIGERESGTAKLEAAVAMQRAALEHRSRDSAALPWEASQSSLAVALTFLGRKQAGTDRLREAVTLYRSALAAEERAHAARAVAPTKVSLGFALSEIGDRENDVSLLAEAASFHRQALTDPSYSRFPYYAARTSCYLGVDLMRLGIRETGTTRLEEADAIFDRCVPWLEAQSAEPLVGEVQQARGAVKTELAQRRALQP